MAVRPYKLEVCTNRLGVAWLRLKAPNGEIVMAGEILKSPHTAKRTADRMAKAGEAGGFKVVEVFEGPRTFEEPTGEAAQ